MFTRRILKILLLCLPLLGCLPGKTYHKVTIGMHPSMAGQVTPTGDALALEAQGIYFVFRPLTYQDLTHPSSLDGKWDFSSPFEGMYDEGAMPLVFFLVLENRTERSITYNPTSSFSLFCGGDLLFPIEYDDFYQDLYTLPDGEGRLASIRKMLFRSYTTLDAGTKHSGLLFFRRPDEWKLKSGDLLLQIRRVYVGKGELDLAIPFKLQVEKVKRPKGS